VEINPTFLIYRLSDYGNQEIKDLEFELILDLLCEVKLLGEYVII